MFNFKYVVLWGQLRNIPDGGIEGNVNAYLFFRYKMGSHPGKKATSPSGSDNFGQTRPLDSSPTPSWQIPGGGGGENFPGGYANNLHKNLQNEWSIDTRRYITGRRFFPALTCIHLGYK